MVSKQISIGGVICLALAALGCTAAPETGSSRAAIVGEPDCDAGVPEMPEDDAGTPDMPGEDAGAPEVPDDDAGMPDGNACTYTQGFYRNHAADWPVLSLTIAGEVYTQADLMAIYGMSTSGDSSISLAHQVITAMLNVAAGATAPAALGDALAFLTANADADGRLPFGFAAGSIVHIQASFYTDALAAFNEGRAGTPHCDDLPGMDGDLDPDVDEEIDEAMFDEMARD